MAHAQAQTHANLAQGLIAGRVICQNRNNWRILTDAGHFVEASVAASCLVSPQKGSEVLLASVRDQFYVFAVLTQPAKTLRVEAKQIELLSEQLIIQNKSTEIKSNELRFDARRIISFAKRAYAEFGQLWQKVRAMHIEAGHYKIKAESISEETSGLHYSQADVLAEKAKVASTQADKILIN